MLYKIISGLAAAIICILLLLVLYANYDARLDTAATLANKNAENIKKVKAGMDTPQVNKIMGQPEDVSFVQQDHIYHYTHKPGTSNSYQVKFDSSFKVIEINIVD